MVVPSCELALIMTIDTHQRSPAHPIYYAQPTFNYLTYRRNGFPFESNPSSIYRYFTEIIVL